MIGVLSFMFKLIFFVFLSLSRSRLPSIVSLLEMIGSFLWFEPYRAVMWPTSHWKSNANPRFAQGLHVLLVDHIAASLTCMTAMLQHHSYKVTSTQVASVALSMITEQKYNFDLVIANADMPDMDIFSFLHQLRKDIPIIMTSATKDMKVAMKSLVEGASFFLMKPISKEDIKYLWQHVYRKKNSPGDLIMTKLNDGKRSYDADIGEEDMEVGQGDDADEGQSKSKRIKMRSHIDLESIKMRKGKENSFDSMNNSTNKKKRAVWSQELCRKFTDVLSQLDKSRVRPKTILKMMNVPSLTRRQVANHLQKYKAQVQHINAKNNREGSSLTGVEFQQVNTSNYLQLSGLYPANLANFDLLGMNTNLENQRYSYDPHSSKSNMLIEQQPQEYAEKQCPNFDDKDEFLTYLNLENLNFEDSNGVVEKADVTGGGSLSDCYIDQLKPLKQYAEMLEVLEEDNNGIGIEQNFSEVDRYCEWLREDALEEDKVKAMI